MTLATRRCPRRGQGPRGAVRRDPLAARRRRQGLDPRPQHLPAPARSGARHARKDHRHLPGQDVEQAVFAGWVFRSTFQSLSGHRAKPPARTAHPLLYRQHSPHAGRLIRCQVVAHRRARAARRRQRKAKRTRPVERDNFSAQSGRDRAGYWWATSLAPWTRARGVEYCRSRVISHPSENVLPTGFCTRLAGAVLLSGAHR